MFHYFKIPYFTCNVFIKFTYKEYIGPYFLSHVVLRLLPSDLPKVCIECMLFVIGHGCGDVVRAIKSWPTYTVIHGNPNPVT